MDNKTVRHKNIEWLVANAGGPTQFGRLVVRDQVQVSQWLGGKNIGDRLARDIEARLGRPVGWLDQPQWDERKLNTEVPQPSQWQRLDAANVVKTVQAMTIVLARRGEVMDLTQPATAELFCDSYEALLQLQGTPGSELALGATVADLVARRGGSRGESGGSESAGGGDRGNARKAGAST